MLPFFRAWAVSDYCSTKKTPEWGALFLGEFQSEFANALDVEGKQEENRQYPTDRPDQIQEGQIGTEGEDKPDP